MRKKTLLAFESLRHSVDTLIDACALKYDIDELSFDDQISLKCRRTAIAAKKNESEDEYVKSIDALLGNLEGKGGERVT